MSETNKGNSNQNWRLAFVMPNLVTRQSFGFGDVAIVGGQNQSLQEIEDSSRAAKALLSGFAGSLSKGQRPAALIYRNPETFGDLWSAMVDARNLLAVASACYGWVQSIGMPNTFAVRYTDYFDFYPRWPAEDGESLVYDGPAVLLMNTNVEVFSGTTHPYLSVSAFSQPTFDDHLLASMMSAWRRIHVRGKPLPGDRRLFRSLSVAYEACRVPQAMDNPLYDHGKHCALWVSAFETLAHSGTWVGFKQVVDLIGKRNLIDSHLKRKVRTKVSMKGGKPHYQALNAAQRLYTRLYYARNKFLHGNKVSIRDFVPGGLKEGVRLLDTAPLVFHAALEASMSLNRLMPGEKNVDEIRQILRDRALEEGFSRALGD